MITDVPGLTVLNLTPDKSYALWYVRHDKSGMQAIPYVRLRKHAEEAAAELAATGADFTLDLDAFRLDPARGKYLKVVTRWHERVKECCVDGEHYSPNTWRDGDGKCHA